jgi:hypothetical protein
MSERVFLSPWIAVQCMGDNKGNIWYSNLKKKIQIYTHAAKQ